MYTIPERKRETGKQGFRNQKISDKWMREREKKFHWNQSVQSDFK